MPVQIQPTPNPNAMKFVVTGVRFARPLSFSTRDAAAEDPLAAQLFALAGVYNVFMAQDFVTVNKLPDVDWSALTPQVQQILEDHLASWVLP
jgi:NFU1 iron-sulfur cluster scaffold homolog, mitochondrial